MLGLGEEWDEIVATLRDLRTAGCAILTLGQYLRPSAAHLPMTRYYHPDEFRELKTIALDMGFTHVESGPLVRSSYHAHEQADAIVELGLAAGIRWIRACRQCHSQGSPRHRHVQQVRASADLLHGDRARQARGVPPRHLLGQAGSRLWRPECARADSRARSCGTRRESHGPRVHRRRRGGSGDFLMTAMHRHGFANIPTSQSIHDGLQLTDAFIAAAVRCAPPDNKPTPEEILACQPHLEAELAQLPNLRVVVALGKIAFDVWWRVMAGRGRRSNHGRGLRMAPSTDPRAAQS